MGSVDLSGPTVDVSMPKISGDVSAPSFDIDLEKPKPDMSLPSVDLSLPSVDVNLPKLSGDIKSPGFNVDIPKPDIELPGFGFKGPKFGGDVKLPSVDGKLPSVSGDIKAPSLDVELKKPDLDVDLPKVDLGVKGPSVDLPGPSVDASLPDVSEKSSRFSFGFGKKGKKKKEKSPKPEVSIPDMTLKADVEAPSLPPPKPPRIDANIDGSAALSVSGPDAVSPSTVISGNEISVSLPDGKVMPNLDVDVQDSLPSLSLEKDTERSLVPKMGLSAKLSRSEVEAVAPKPEVNLELPTVDLETPDTEKKGGFSFSFGSKREKKKKQKKDDDIPSPDASAEISADVTLPDVDGSGVMKNWYKEKSKSPSKDKKKSGGISLGFGGKSDKEVDDIEGKAVDLDVPQDAKVKKKGSFLGGLIKKGSKAKDAKDISLKYKGKLKDNEGSIEDIDVKANLEGDAKGVALDVDLPSVTLKDPEISKGGTTRGFKLFNDAPDHKDGTAAITINGKEPTATLDTGGGLEVEVEKPQLDINLPSVETDLDVKEPNITLPSFGIKSDTSMPKGSVDIDVPSVELDVKK